MNQLFHIGIPKSGTTTLQKTLQNDPRIHLTHFNSFFGYGKNSESYLKDNLVGKIRKRLKYWVALTISAKNKEDFFNLNTVAGYSKLLEEFRNTNKMLISLGLIDDLVLKKYKYPL